MLRFRDSRNKIDKSPPPPYILIWTKLLGGWPLIVNGGCIFALQSRFKFIDQVRILAKTRILWNHGRVLLCLCPGEILFSTFGVNLETFLDTCSNSRGLECPGAIQPGMLDFSSGTFQTATIAKSCSFLGRSKRFAILEWGLVNPEKIDLFLERMNSDLFFRNYYFGLYDFLRLLHLRIFDQPAIVVSEVEKKWSSKIDNILDEERRTLERCEEEINIRRAWVEHLERIKADDQGDRNLRRKKLPALSTWKQKTKRHVGKRFGSGL